MSRLKRWRCTIREHDTAMLWAMLLFIVLTHFGPALWATYRVVAGNLPALALPLLLVLLVFSAWLARPICGELARRPWTPLFRGDRRG